jgi:hypothetical protein
VQRDVTRANKVTVLPEIAGTCLDKGNEIDALAKMFHGEQRALAEAAKRGETVSAKCATVPKNEAAAATDNVAEADPAIADAAPHATALDILKAWLAAAPAEQARALGLIGRIPDDAPICAEIAEELHKIRAGLEQFTRPNWEAACERMDCLLRQLDSKVSSRRTERSETVVGALQ